MLLGKRGNTTDEVALFVYRGIIQCNLRIKNLLCVIVEKTWVLVISESPFYIGSTARFQVYLGLFQKDGIDLHNSLL